MTVKVSRLAPRVLMTGLEKIESSSSSRCSAMDSGGEGELLPVSAAEIPFGDRTTPGLEIDLGLASSSWLGLAGPRVFTAGL